MLNCGLGSKDTREMEALQEPPNWVVGKAGDEESGRVEGGPTLDHSSRADDHPVGVGARLSRSLDRMKRRLE